MEEKSHQPQSQQVPIQKINVVFPPDAVTQLLFKKYVDENTLSFLTLLKEIITKDRSAEIAQQIYQKIIKVSTQVAFLYKQKYVTKAQIGSLRFIFRRLCSTTINAFRFKGLQPVDSARIKHISSIFRRFGNGIIELIGPYLKDSCLIKVGLIFDYFCSDDFLQFCFMENSGTFKELVFILSYYLEIS